MYGGESRDLRIFMANDGYELFQLRVGDEEFGLESCVGQLLELGVKSYAFGLFFVMALMIVDVWVGGSFFELVAPPYSVDTK